MDALVDNAIYKSFPDKTSIKRKAIVLDGEMAYKTLDEWIKACASKVYNIQRLDRFLDGVFAITSANAHKSFNSDFFNCALCQGYLIDPVTLACGETFMKSCVVLDERSELWSCPSCKKTCNKMYVTQLKPSVTIVTLLEKWCKKAFKGSKIFFEAKQLMQQNKAAEAIEKYNLALEFDPTNPLIFVSRSQSFLSLGQNEEALNDADAAIRSCPTWALGYHHKATILLEVKKYEEAIQNFLHCYTLDEGMLVARSAAKMLIHLMFYSPDLDSTLPVSWEEVPANAFPQDSSFHAIPNIFHSSDDSSDGGADPVKEFDPFASENNIPFDVSPAFRQILCNLIHTLQETNQGKPNGEIAQEQKDICDTGLETRTKEFLKKIDRSLVDQVDFECPICRRLLYEPVTTPCGHTFCLTCLDRCFDHNTRCPLCKTILEHFISEKRNVTKLIDYAIQVLLPNEYSERKEIYCKEMQEFANAGKDLEHAIPLFVCTIAYPTLPCPLHVFEPRYRLMIRQCLESGTNQFGMCAYVNYHNGRAGNIANIGTMLKITKVKVMPDGRSVITTVGGQRFRILQYGMRDGYNTGAVEFLTDQPPQEHEKEELIRLHDQTRNIAVSWFCSLPEQTRETILRHFGSMPDVEENYFDCADGPSWLWWVLAVLPLQPSVQLLMLGMTSLSRRLEVLGKIFHHIRDSPVASSSL